MSLYHNETERCSTYTCDRCGEEAEFLDVSFEEGNQNIKDAGWAFSLETLNGKNVWYHYCPECRGEENE